MSVVRALPFGWLAAALGVLSTGCRSAVEPTEPPPTPTEVDTGLPTLPFSNDVEVTVTLDGNPVANAFVRVGAGMSTVTNVEGRADVQLNGGEWLIAAHPDARIAFRPINGSTALLELDSFSLDDNEDYVFQDPGTSGDRGNSSQCGHCHQSMLTDWTESTHRDAASNSVVHDVYAGTIDAGDESSCADRGGVWMEGLQPGTVTAMHRCYLGDGTLPDLNADCGETVACDAVATATGGCADCHAPGIDGQVGGRSLLEATGRAFDEGIHCDVCHKVENVDLAGPPGVAGALRILRPAEPSNSITEDWLHLTFGPYPDVPNPRMGAVPREHFLHAEFCGGCHESVQQALVPGDSLDVSRWPDGLPVHSTFSEWQDGAYAPSSPCQSCHMPPETRWGNSADFRGDEPLIGPTTGWFRQPGTVRRHLFDGPHADGELLRLAAAVDLETSVVEGLLTVAATTRNVGAGHAIPTGEPMRSLLLVVQAVCGTEVLEPSGGDVVPGFGGALDTKTASDDWTLWPGAQVGDQIRVVERAGFRAYEGPGRFGDGSFTTVEKGLADTRWSGRSTILGVNGEAVTLDRPLPAGDIAYRVDGVGLPADGELSRAWAGAPGFAFARVMADSGGREQVAHHRAVDVRSDNRLMPQQSWTSSHTFISPCADPVVTAHLVHRPYPLAEARLRSWEGRDKLMVETSQ